MTLSYGPKCVCALLLSLMAPMSSFVVDTGFQQAQRHRSKDQFCVPSRQQLTSSSLCMSDGGPGGTVDLQPIEEYLQSSHPMFYNFFLRKHDDLWKELRDTAEGSCTVFAPSNEAIEALGDSKLVQLRDDRNSETWERMAMFHFITEPVTSASLFESGGVVSLAGANNPVPVERTMSGGMFGLGGKEDGGVTVGGARIIESYELDGGHIVHITDDLVSPSTLWRYNDQLRIPVIQK